MDIVNDNLSTNPRTFQKFSEYPGSFYNVLGNLRTFQWMSEGSCQTPISLYSREFSAPGITGVALVFLNSIS